MNVVVQVISPVQLIVWKLMVCVASHLCIKRNQVPLPRAKEKDAESFIVRLMLTLGLSM